MPLIHIDFFINNKCNLKCKHCYVSPEMNKVEEIATSEIIRALDQSINLGARTIGCTGKEPLLSFDKVEKVFRFLYEKKKSGANIIYGIVTNGIFLDKKKARKLNKLELNYLDISLEGTEKINDLIRGKGNYQRTINNLENLLKLGLNHLNKDDIFIDFTLGRFNNENLTDLVIELFRKGLQNIYISPYQSITHNDEFVLTPKEYASSLRKILDNSKNYKNMRLFFKNDCSTKENIYELEQQKIIDLNKLHRDELGVVYSIRNIDSNKFYFNLLNKNNNFMIRLNSNGDITDCAHMFKGQNYKKFGNVREKPISKILNLR